VRYGRPRHRRQHQDHGTGGSGQPFNSLLPALQNNLHTATLDTDESANDESGQHRQHGIPPVLIPTIWIDGRGAVTQSAYKLGRKANGGRVEAQPLPGSGKSRLREGVLRFGCQSVSPSGSAFVP
jgi:hypothetical protein